MDRTDFSGRLITTVVGSFPLHNTQNNANRIIKDQISLGIDVPGVPQLEDMNMMFLKSLSDQNCGIEFVDGKPTVVDALTEPRYPIAAAGLRNAQKYVYNNDLQHQIKGFKTCVTGPFTLAEKMCINGKSALQEPDFVERIAYIVRKIVKDLDRCGASIITVDEPVLNFGISFFSLDEDLVVDCLNIVFKDISRAISSVHVCGDVFCVNNLLLQVKGLDYLDHEFATIPENLIGYTKQDLELHDKMIGYGCVATAIDPLLMESIRRGNMHWQEAVESELSIKKRILDAIQRFGVENIIIDPDCGFGSLRRYVPPDIAYLITLEKLRKMVNAVQSLRKEIMIHPC